MKKLTLQSKRVVIALILITITLLYFILIHPYWETDRNTEQSKSNKGDSKGEKVLLGDQKNGQQLTMGTIQQLDQKSKVFILSFAVKIDQLEKANTKNMKSHDFLTILRAGLESFPTKADIRQLGDQEVHTIPVPISLAGEYLGHLQKHLKNEPRLLDTSLVFYDECARKQTILISVKALCLANLSRLSKLHGKSLDITKYDKQVIKLAKYAEMTN